MYNKILTSLVLLLGLLVASCSTPSKVSSSNDSVATQGVGAVATEDPDDYFVIYFDFDSNEVSGSERKKVTSQSEAVKGKPEQVLIEGHTDDIGTREYNLALGERRADAVKRELEKKGVKSSRIKVVSYGEDNPAAAGTTDGDRAQNRRAVTSVTE